MAHRAIRRVTKAISSTLFPGRQNPPTSRNGTVPSRRTRFVMVAVVSIMTALFFVSESAFPQLPGDGQHGQIMERKLDSVQKVMEGMARANFDQIEKQAQLLSLLSREAGWNVLVTEDYLRLSEEFRATVGRLQHAAEKKNLDAVGLAFVKLSISCIECHRYAREEMPRVGRRDGTVVE